MNQRVKIQLPGNFGFQTDIRVRITDLNYGNHLGNDALLSMIHEARVRYLNSLGYTETDLEGVSLILADVMIRYRMEGFYGNIIRFEVAPGDFSSSSFNLFYRVTNAETGQLMAEAKTGMVTFNYDERKVVQIPQRVVEKMMSDEK